ALDSLDAGPVSLYGKHQARMHRSAIEEHEACAANTHLAAEMRAGQLHLLPQEIGERHAWGDRLLHRLAIDLDRDVQHRAHATILPRSRPSSTRARCNRIPAGTLSSSIGEMSPASASCAARIASASSRLPTRSPSALRARSAVGPTERNASRMRRTTSPSNIPLTPSPTMAKSPLRRDSSSKAQRAPS